MCAGWSLAIGIAYRGAVVRRDRIDQPPTWSASVNAAFLGEYFDRKSAMVRVEADIEHHMEWCCTIGSCIGRRRGSGRNCDGMRWLWGRTSLFGISRS
jgi:hypothetical protein